MEPNTKTGIIYSITCRINEKSYIGQAKDYKYKNNRPYRYGLDGRWSDHMSSKDKTFLHQDIRKYGKDEFVVKFIIRCNISDLDCMEAKMIFHNNTLVPNGYNVAKHSRVKNREETNIADFYLDKASHVEIKPVKRNGNYRLVYVYVKNKNETKRTRLTFGQGKESNFDNAKNEAMKFVIPFRENNIPVSVHPDILGIDDIMNPYHDKINSLRILDITDITVSKNKSGSTDLIVLKIRHKDCKTNIDEIKVCFGGKTINTYDAYKISKEFIQRIKCENTQIKETELLQQFLKSATGSCE